jgi:TolB-like protein/Tfp pilus assembly protein PilF
MIYRFGDFELDADQVELRRDGARLAVEPQVFALLRLLVERRERLVTKDEIIEEVWNGRIISESALSSRIKFARQALGDDGATQQWIRTIHGQGFRFVGEVTIEGPPVTPESDPAERLAEVMARPMVAVFPFEQETFDPSDAYFVDGFAEDLMAELASWRWFPILSRNAAFASGRRDVPIAERAAALGARYAVGGRMQRVGQQARLSVELVDAASGAQLWSARFERDVARLVEMQAQIAAEVFQRIAPELTSAERRRILRKAPEDLTAWDMTLKALWALNRASPDDFAEALEQLETATRLDPASPLPWNLISLIHYETALKGWVGGRREAVQQTMQSMLSAARKAVEIDPSGWMGHSLASAGELWAGASYTRARYHADQALDLNPSAGLAHHFSGCVYGFGGDLQEAITVQSQAFRIDPDYMHTDVIEADLGLWHFLLGDCDAAKVHLERAIAFNPRNTRARQRIVALLGSLGDVEGARAELDRLVELAGPLTPEYLTASYPFQRPEHFARLAAGLQRAGVVLDE